MYVIFFYTLTESVLFPYKHMLILEKYNDKIPLAQTTLLQFSKKLTRNSATWDKMNSQNFKQNLITFFVLKDSTFTLTVTYYNFFQRNRMHQNTLFSLK